MRIWTGRELGLAPEEDADFGAKAEKGLRSIYYMGWGADTFAGISWAPLFQPMGGTSG